jgi:hypothetical protein
MGAPSAGKCHAISLRSVVEDGVAARTVADYIDLNCPRSAHATRSAICSSGNGFLGGFASADSAFGSCRDGVRSGGQSLEQLWGGDWRREEGKWDEGAGRAGAGVTTRTARRRSSQTLPQKIPGKAARSLQSPLPRLPVWLGQAQRSGDSPNSSFRGLPPEANS